MIFSIKAFWPPVALWDPRTFSHLRCHEPALIGCLLCTGPATVWKNPDVESESLSVFFFFFFDIATANSDE